METHGTQEEITSPGTLLGLWVDRGMPGSPCSCWEGTDCEKLMLIMKLIIKLVTKLMMVLEHQ